MKHKDESLGTTLKQRIDQLPELPVATFEVAGELDYADNVPVVTIRPKKLPDLVKPMPSPEIPYANASSYAVRSYWVQVTYPRVICSPPGDPTRDPGPVFVAKGTGESARLNAGSGVIAQGERFYKLTNLKGTRLGNPYWCSVKYGPWLAMATEETSCIIGMPSRWDLWIVE